MHSSVVWSVVTVGLHVFVSSGFVQDWGAGREQWSLEGFVHNSALR